MYIRKLLDHYKKLPDLARMSITAVMGAGIGYITYELIFYINPIIPKASSSWFIAFVIGIARQHGLHRWLTFSHKTPYWKSLFRAYIMYSTALLVSSGLNWYLTEQLSINHRLAWLCCGLISALFSLFFLRKFVFKKNWK